MKRLVSFCAIASLLFLMSSVAAYGQFPPEEALKRLQAREDLEVTLFASEPLITNPTSIDVDAYGRVWVCEGQWYRARAKNPPADCVKVLEDTDGDGRADKVTTFADGLLVPMGVCVAGDRVYVAEAPNVWVYEDRDGDLKPDGPRRALLTGFRGYNHDHGVHGLVLGPDHKLYMTQGDQGFDVTGPDGRRVAYRWGAMLRCELDGTQLEAFAVNFRNPYELAVNSFGDVWCSDNDRDGLRSVRICWILEGGNYGWYGGPLMIRNPDGSYDPRYHWRAFRPGIVPYVLITGFGSPCGMTFYEADRLGEDFKGQLLHADAGPRVVRCYHITPYGAGFTAAPEIVLTTEQDPYFRPVDVCVAPDGSLFVADWYDVGVGGHAYNNPEQGRIYLVRKKGAQRAPVVPPPPYETVEDALAGLQSPNLATQYLARERLIRAGTEAIPALLHLARIAEPHIAARALWVLDRTGEAGRKHIVHFLRHRDERFRVLAVRILRRHGAQYARDYLALAADPSAQVRREVLLAIAALDDKLAWEPLVNLVRQWDGSDRFYLEAIGIAARGRPERAQRLIDELLSPVPRWGVREVMLYRLLRGDEEATEELVARLRTGKLTTEAMPVAIEPLAYATDVQAGILLADIAARRKLPPEARYRALEALRIGLTQHWAQLRTAREVEAALAAALEDNNLVALAVTIATEAGMSGLAPHLARVARSTDYAPELRRQAIEAIGRLNAQSEAGALAALVDDPNPEVRRSAIHTLVQLGQFRPLHERLLKSDNSERSTELIQGLLSTVQGALSLLPLVSEEGRISDEMRRQIVAAAVRHPDVSVRTLFQPYAKGIELPRPLGEVIRPEEILALKGDPARGRKLFESAGTAPCIRCHMVNGKGGDIGPDLSHIGRKYDRAGLLDAILYPSKAIAPEFRAYLVATTDGRIYAGFLRENSDERVVVHTAEGQIVAIPREKVEAIQEQSVSIMPELTIGSMTAQDAADLLAFLESLKQQTQTITGWWVVGPFHAPGDEAYDRVFPPERTPGQVDVDQRYRVGKRELAWTPVGSMLFQGYQGLDFVRFARERGERDHHVAFYAAVTIESPAEQDATLLLGSDDGIKVWLNGQLVHSVHAHRAAAYAQDEVKVRLKQGANLLLVKVEQQTGPSGLIAAVAVENPVVFLPPRN